MDTSSSRNLLRAIRRSVPSSGPRPVDSVSVNRAIAIIERIHASRGRLDTAPGNVSADELCASIGALLGPGEESSAADWPHAALVALILKECIGTSRNADTEHGMDHNLSELSSFAKPLIVEYLISHDEPRVRKVTAELIGAMAAKLGPPYVIELAPVLCSQVSAFFVRKEVSREARLGTDSEIALDDTTGWYALESLLCSYRELIGGCGPSLQYLSQTPEMEIDLFIRQSSLHINRYIRQATFEFIHMLMSQCAPGSMHWVGEQHTDLICSCIAAGLSDDFSQVRFPATFAAKFFLIAIDDDDRERYVWELLLPRLCLNRYYPADGVKSASMDAWSAATKGRGRELVTRHIKAAFEHYASMVDNKSHLICEAACWVLGELGSIIDASVVAPYLAGILDILGVCLGDDSWQVRGAACVATGRVIEAHPSETCSRACDTFLPLWTLHLNDYIWALRSDSAAALGKAMRSPEEQLATAAIQASIQYLNDNLAAAKVKKVISFIPRNSSLYAFVKNKPEDDLLGVPGPRPGPTAARAVTNAETRQRFGVVELKRRPGSWGCCMDCSSGSIERKRWQTSEGAVLLLKELADVVPDKAADFLETCVDLLKHYENSEYGKLHNTIWQQLSAILHCLGRDSAVLVAPELLRRYLIRPPAESSAPARGALIPPQSWDSGPAASARRNVIRTLASLLGNDNLCSVYQTLVSPAIVDGGADLTRLRAVVSSPLEDIEASALGL